MTKTSKNAINSLLLPKPYGVLCINGNDYVRNENEDTSQRTIKIKRFNVVTKTVKLSRNADCTPHIFAWTSKL